MAIEGVKSSVPYTASEQTKYSSSSADVSVESAGVTENRDALKVTETSSLNMKENSGNTKEQEKHIKSVVDQVNKQINKRTRCEFKYYEETNRVAIKVIDRDTDKVIREIPPEKTLEMVEKMWELAGLLVDEKR